MYILVRGLFPVSRTLVSRDVLRARHTMVEPAYGIFVISSVVPPPPPPSVNRLKGGESVAV